MMMPLQHAVRHGIEDGFQGAGHPGAADRTECLGQLHGHIPDEMKLYLQRKEHRDGAKVEKVMDGGPRKGTTEVLPTGYEAERNQQIGDGCADVGAHDNRYRQVQGQGAPADETDGYRRRGGRTLDYPRGQNADEKSDDRIRTAFDQRLCELLAEQLKRVPHERNAQQEQVQEKYNADHVHRGLMPRDPFSHRIGS